MSVNWAMDASDVAPLTPNRPSGDGTVAGTNAFEAALLDAMTAPVTDSTSTNRLSLVEDLVRAASLRVGGAHASA